MVWRGAGPGAAGRGAGRATFVSGRWATGAAGRCSVPVGAGWAAGVCAWLALGADVPFAGEGLFWLGFGDGAGPDAVGAGPLPAAGASPSWSLSFSPCAAP